ncbi:MAG: UDP-N-acetylmuramate dehydrogenase [Xanthomonadales bacterium]|nr:UDP-N-acetylmuramate dehydrogenase [Xanthomonadales bacterium]
MKRILNASLKHLNSFAVEARAGRLLELESEEDLQKLIPQHRFDVTSDLILGGGSNVVFAGDIEGTVILNRVTGKKIVEDANEEVVVEACAGENWHQLVLWCLDRGLSGIENLSLIPGLVGAAPMQNIGAYGVELADVLDSVVTLDLQNGVAREFKQKDCHFSYRNSRFKSADAGKYLVTGIRLRLQRGFKPKLAYKGLSEELQSMGIDSPTAKQVSDSVIRIRQRKLPDPMVNGNAGSFFKNPVVSRAMADSLAKEFADLPVYPAGNKAKLSAGWLVEACGWKGRSMGRAAVSAQHALVLINIGNATGSEILELADAISKSVRARFGIELEPEPLIIRS